MAKRRRNNSVADGLSAFASTYKLARGVMQDSEMAAAAGEKQTEDTGFTVEQGEQLDALANAKDESGNNFYKVEATEGGKYHVTPNKEVFEARGASAELTNSTAEINPGKRFTFQGVTRDKEFTEAEQDRGRTMAQAGILAKYGDTIQARALRSSANDMEEQSLKTQAAQQGLQLGRYQVDAAKLGADESARKLATQTALADAGAEYVAAQQRAEGSSEFLSNLAQATQAGGNPTPDGRVAAGGVSAALLANKDIDKGSAAKLAGARGIEAMVRATVPAGTTEEQIQAAISQYQSSAGDARHNQYAASRNALYEKQAAIWQQSGNGQAQAEAAYKMAEAEGMPKALEFVMAGRLDEANKVYNAQGDNNALVVSTYQDGGDVFAVTVDPLTGKKGTFNATQMQKQMMSMRDQLGIKKDEANIAQSDAAIRQGDARVAEERRHNTAAEGISLMNADKASRSSNPAAVQTAEWLVANGVAKDNVAAWSMLGESKTKDRKAAIIDMAGKLVSGGTVKMEDAIKQATIAVDSVRGTEEEGKPVFPAAGTKATIGGRPVISDGKGWLTDAR